MEPQSKFNLAPPKFVSLIPQNSLGRVRCNEMAKATNAKQSISYINQFYMERARTQHAAGP